MRYAVLGGGKRLRAIMAVAACESVGGVGKQALGLAAAMEMIHAYSLVHDDLPCMDDDDFRRGKPTVHRKYGEAVAVLVGDALLTEAFAELARMPEKYGVDHHTTVAVMGELAFASGSHGMVGGQVADILGAQKAEAADQAVLLHYIHSHKTGALFKAALRCGGLIGGASPDQLGTLTEFGEHFGLAFQITDDILDEVGEAEALGKAVGRDREMGKLTYPSLFGLEKARAMAQESAAKCLAALEGLPVRSQVLQELALMVAERDH
ncbi:MAG TPA: polyprenyl synthetase family protein [Firmicutes bacterium]|nr:polyprenyl synthetase family protein [Bacillota bacterium]